METRDYINYSLKKLIEQGHRCVDPVSGNCVYEDEKGNRCAIGWLLPEPPPVETKALVEDLLVVPKFIEDNIEEFIALQAVHDLDAVHSVEERKILLEAGADPELLNDWIKLIKD